MASHKIKYIGTHDWIEKNYYWKSEICQCWTLCLKVIVNIETIIVVIFTA